MSANEETSSNLLMEAQSRLKAGDLGSAADVLVRIHNSEPDNSDCLYLLAVVRRYQNRLDEALNLISRLTALQPNLGRAWQEYGHCLRAKGEHALALKSYQSCVKLDPGALAAWSAIEELHSLRSEELEAKLAREQIVFLKALPAALLTVKTLIAEGRLDSAEHLCRAFIKKSPHHPEAMRLLAEIGWKYSILDDAEVLLDGCITLYPDHLPARFDYANVLIRQQKIVSALGQSEVLISQDPHNEAYRLQRAKIRALAGDFQGALEIYNELIALRPRAAHIHLSRGHALKTVGRQSEAVSAYRQAYTVRPEFGDAYWSLANLKTYRFTDGEIDAMRRWQADPATPLVDRYHLSFALGKGLEDQGNFAESFTHYTTGNDLKRQELGYDWRRITKEMALQSEHCTQELFDAKRGVGAKALDPIFIVGLPRAGSTLLEQILASHSQVEGTMELPNILALSHRLNGRLRVEDEPVYPGNLIEFDTAKLTTFGEHYLRDTQIHRKLGRARFIDKMPNNFRHIGLIHLILPNAKIIDARRSAMGCCFSGFKQLFAEGQEFTYGQEEIGHYYRDYVGLMDHWDRVLPGKVLRVNYEAVVSNLEDEVRRLLDFCELPFEEACIHFHQTERAVRTASSEQVRQPLFTSGLDQWTHCSEFLDPLRAALGPELVAS